MNQPDIYIVLRDGKPIAWFFDVSSAYKYIDAPEDDTWDAEMKVATVKHGDSEVLV